MKKYKVSKSEISINAIFSTTIQYDVIEVSTNKKVFTGSISECYAFIQLAENNYF
jgi:hypothetical protein